LNGARTVVFVIGDKQVVVVMPAYNAEQTLEQTVQCIDRTIVDEIILVDDASMDNTLALAEQLGLMRPTTSIRDTGPTRRRATKWLWNAVRTSSS
jgi:glycosyltransferase involved in cell wall biosynthesis